MSDRGNHQPSRQNETAEAIAAERPRAVLYFRCASSRQADRDLSVVAQQHVCQWRAHELGAIVVAEFTDFGSGLSLERQCLTELIAKVTELRAITNQRIYVIAADHARIGRSVQAYSRASWEIERAGAMLMIASVPLVEYEQITGWNFPAHSAQTKSHSQASVTKEDRTDAN
jgi:hypothetical protein